MSKTKILIVGANGAMGSMTLLKLYGNENLSVMILPFELEIFLKNKEMHEDEWFPSDKTCIPKEAFVVDKEPSSGNEVGVFTTKTLPAGFFEENGVVIISSKIFHYNSVIDSIKHALHKDTIMTIIVNGLNPELTLEEICRDKGVNNLITRTVVMGGTHYKMYEDRISVHSGIANFVIGHWKKEYSPEYQKQLTTITDLFPKDRFIAQPLIGNDFRLPCFDKVLANLVNPVSAFTCCPTIEYVEVELLREIITKCFNQGIDIGLTIGLPLKDREDIINRKLEMYEKAGLTSKAHLPSMGQDSLRALLGRTPLYNENEHIGIAIVKEGLKADKPYKASYIAGFSNILTQVTEYYNKLHKKNKKKASKFLLELMMRNRYSLGLNPNNTPLYEQFEGLKELESQISIDFTKVKRIKDCNEATDIFQENLTCMMKD